MLYRLEKIFFFYFGKHHFWFVSWATLAAIPFSLAAEFLERLLYCARTSFIRFKISFALSFRFPTVDFIAFDSIFFAEDEWTTAFWFDVLVLVFFPASLSIASFCLSRSAGEYSFFFNSVLVDFIDPVLERLYPELRLAWLLRCDETTGLTGGLYSVFRGGMGVVLIFGVVLSNWFFDAEPDKLRSFLISLVLFNKFCLTRLLDLPVRLLPRERGPRPSDD